MSEGRVERLPTRAHGHPKRIKLGNRFYAFDSQFTGIQERLPRLFRGRFKPLLDGF